MQKVQRIKTKWEIYIELHSHWTITKANRKLWIAINEKKFSFFIKLLKSVTDSVWLFGACEWERSQAKAPCVSLMTILRRTIYKRQVWINESLKRLEYDKHLKKRNGERREERPELKATNKTVKRVTFNRTIDTLSLSTNVDLFLSVSELSRHSDFNILMYTDTVGDQIVPSSNFWVMQVT